MGVVRSFVKRHSAVRNAAFLMENLAAVARRPQVRVDRSGGDQEFFLAAMVRVKNEGRFLPEWIAHSWLSGIEHFFVYDNGSTDDTKGTLQPLVDLGVVTYVPWPESPIYPAADLDFFRRFGHLCKWVAFFDPDEFIVEGRSGRFVDTLRECDGYPAIGINWRYFGSGFKRTLPPGLVISNFELADAHLNDHVKVVLQPRMLRRLRNPHNGYYAGGRLARTVSGGYVFAAWGRPVPLAQSELHLNHYVYRSAEDYRRKATQGFADTKRSGELPPRTIERIESEFGKHNECSASFGGDVIAGVSKQLAAWGYSESGAHI